MWHNWIERCLILFYFKRKLTLNSNNLKKKEYIYNGKNKFWMIFVRTDWIDRPWIYFKRALWSRIASFILELVSVLRKCVFFFSEGEYVTNFVYRGTGCIGTNCSLTKCLCTAGRERNIMGQSKNSSISGRDSGWKCLILLKCWLFGGGWFHICTCIRFFINIFSFRHNPISCFLPSSPIAFF